jgi:sortase B
MKTVHSRFCRLARHLLPILALALLVSSCGEIRPLDAPVPTALQIGYRRMFNHDRSELAYAPFVEAVQKSGSITLARLDNAEDTGEGYAIYTFTVMESLYNPDGDKIINLYEGIIGGAAAPKEKIPVHDAAAETASAGAFVGTSADPPAKAVPAAYQKGLIYLLCLSRATDVYYPHPFFHNFNGIHISADEKGNIIEAVNADGRDNLKKNKETRQFFKTTAEAAEYVKTLQDGALQQRGLYRFAGREVASEDPAAISELSDYIAEVRTDRVVYQNRYIQEVACTIIKPYKGLFGLGSGPDPAGNATPPATDILPGHRQIVILFPAGLDVSSGKKWLVFLYEDAEYRISSRSSAIPVDSGYEYDRFVAIVEPKPTLSPEPENVIAAPTPEAAIATPTPSPKVFTLLEEYKGFADKNPDVRGWIRQEGTVIDYPVLQSKDNDWYLSRNMDRKKVVSGSIVLDFRVDIRNLARNTPIYGHNMKHGSMFHSLVNYKTEKYYKEHPVIRFDTLYEKMEWEIFAVYVVDSGYNYVITMDFADDAAFLLFLNDIEKRTMYPMPFEVTTDDKILTMVTCSYEFDGARTVIQARLKK